MQPGVVSVAGPSAAARILSRLPFQSIQLPGHGSMPRTRRSSSTAGLAGSSFAVVAREDFAMRRGGVVLLLRKDPAFKVSGERSGNTLPPSVARRSWSDPAVSLGVRMGSGRPS